MFCSIYSSPYIFDSEALAFNYQNYVSQLKLVQTVVRLGDTRNLCYKFNSQGPALRTLGFRVTCSKFQGPSSRVLGVSDPSPRVPVQESWVSGYLEPGSQSPRVAAPRSHGPRVPGPRIPGLRVQGLRS